MDDVVLNYFYNIFSSQGCGEQQVVLDVIEDRITGPMNSILTAAYSNEEIREALFQCI